MPEVKNKRHGFLVWELVLIAVICFFYIYIQWQYIHRLPLVMDEFQQASSSLRAVNDIPYLDYLPYKTLLGYYSQSWILQIYSQADAGGTWAALLKCKESIALLNAFILFALGVYCRKLFDIKAVLFGLVSLVLVSTFLERSSELRVDMLTAWFGLAGLLLLLNRRLVLAGVFTGLSFLVSQKGVYYSFAICVSYGSYCLIWLPLRDALKSCFLLSVSILVPIAIYIILWASVSGFEQVITGIFLRNTHIVFDDIYQDMNRFWFQMIRRNLIFFIIVGVSFVYFFVQACKRRIGKKSAIIALYSLVLLLLCVSNKQPWPYFFVLLLPTLALLMVAFSDDLMGSVEKKCVVRVASILIVVSFTMFLIRFPLVVARDNYYQKETITLLESMLPSNGTYFSGFNASLKFRHISGIGLSWLDVRSLKKLWAAEDGAVVLAIKKDMPMLILDNYRIQKLPPDTKNFLANSYTNFCRGIWIYSLSSGEENQKNYVYFSGRYMAITAAGYASLNDVEVKQGSVVNLQKGDSVTMKGLTLIFYPEEIEREIKKVEKRVSQGYCRQSRLFYRVYSY